MRVPDARSSDRPSSSIAELPYVDEHAIDVDAPPQEVWGALWKTLSRSTGASSLAARALGCDDCRADSGGLPAVGTAIVGFRVARAHPPAELALEGRHRFSRYALVFQIEELGGAASRLRAETRADFPGVAGRAYRLLVIGSKGHVVAVRRLLRGVKHRAERMR
jgi:hypothetical protein